jgi:hypothetical protein
VALISFAWVDATETVFGPQHMRVDEAVFAFEMTHAEANAPTCDVTIKNPYVGLVEPGRKEWIWMAYTDVANVTIPFFFGRLIAPPNDTVSEKITIRFLARAVHWLRIKQLMADQLRDDPYDPIFVSADLRSDPDKALEFRSTVWHFDRITSGSPSDLQVTISDILTPEDGWEVFQASDHFYNKFKWTVAQQQLKSVFVKSDVHWTQRGAGRLNMNTGNVTCWTGGSIIEGWPKGGTSMPGGYTVAAASAFGSAQYGTPFQHKFHWENTAKTHQTGDAMSEDATWTSYPVGGDLIRFNIFIQPGIINPFASATLGGDPGINIPLHVQWTELLVCQWYVLTTLVLDYDVNRPRHEKLEFRLDADLQPIFTDTHPEASAESEIMKISGTDVGLPILKVWSWYTLSATRVTVNAGTIVVSTPEFIGGPLYAVARNTGIVGTTEPLWTDILGQQIVDGTVTWIMIGATVPTEFPTWKDVSASQVVAGTMIRAQFYLAAPVDYWGQPLPTPPAGTQSIQMAITTGNTQEYANGVNGVADQRPSWPEPQFPTTAGGITDDGGVSWLSLGNGQDQNTVLDLPVGINPANNAYFSSDRGSRSIRALINMARAKHRMRNRVIKMEFETTFDRGLDLSCRKGVLIYDRRLPGGSAYGKITSYTLSGEGASGTGSGGGKFRCTVTAEASCGFGDVSGAHPPITVQGGTDGYVVDGYAVFGWTYEPGATVPASGIFIPPTSTGSQPPSVSGIANGDVGYTPPAHNVSDDGVTFPITDPGAITYRMMWITGKPPAGPEYVPNAIVTLSAIQVSMRYGTVTETFINVPIPNGFAPVTWQQQYTDRYTGDAITQTYIQFYPVTQLFLELKDLNRPFANQFGLKTTLLELPMMVNEMAGAQP